MKFIVTIDAEEDEWNARRSATCSVTNALQLPAFQALCDRYGIRPTYLLTYPMTQDHRVVRIFSDLIAKGTCEIGSHCHPWNTPPFDEKLTDVNSMLCNLSADLQLKKLETLDDAIQRRLGVKPVSFRAGRWAFCSEVARHLLGMGYKIDSSVTPYVNWKSWSGPDFTDYPLRPYRLNLADLHMPVSNGKLLEIPATIGLLGSSGPLAEKVWKAISRENLAFLKGPGVLARLGIVRKVWLSPELADGASMIGLIRQLRGQGHTCFNMVLHSSSLMAGMTPFVQTPAEEARLWQRMDAVFQYVSSNGMRPVTLAEVCADYE